MAQTFTIHDTWALQNSEGTWRERGVSVPSIAYDTENSEYVMFFNSFVPSEIYEAMPEDYSGCETGVYFIGRARSTDGLTFVADEDPIIIPQPGTYYSCHVAHPSAVYDNGTWRLWFKTEQQTNPCEGEVPPWGCSNFTGFAYAESTDNGDTWSISDEPILPYDAWAETSGMGFPSVIRLEDQWVMYAVNTPNIYLATAPEADSGWSAVADPLLEPGANDWMEDELFSPALTCDEAESFPITFYFGGRDLSGVWGFGRAASEGPAELPYVSSQSPYAQWAAEDKTNRWANFDAMRIPAASEEDEDIWVMYFKAKDSNNRGAIGVAYTSETWSAESIADRMCVTVVTDGDGDGYDAPEFGGDDCNDEDADVNPGADEIWYDGTDQDCDGNDTDQDSDGFDAEETGGDDCDDENPDVNPGVADPIADGVDRDCDGIDGPPDSGQDTGGEPGGGEGCCKKNGSDGAAALLLLPLVLLRRRFGRQSTEADRK